MSRYATQAQRALLAMAAVVIGLGAGCGGSSNGGSGFTSVAAEPTAGTWQLITPTPSAIVLAAPPGAATTAAEIAELKALRASAGPAEDAAARFWDDRACVRWNEIARNLVATTSTNPPRASRAYALLAVAQYDALVQVYANKYAHNRPAPAQTDPTLVPLLPARGDPVYPSEHAAIAGASAAILSFLYPSATAQLEISAAEAGNSRLWAGLNYRSDVAAGDQLGRAVAQAVLARAATDGSDLVFTGTIPTGTAMWTGTNPLLPLWGQVRPWLVTSVAAIRPAPPPLPGSPQFDADLAEVRLISDARTPEQLFIARFWADGAATVTPPGHWNQIACDEIVAHRLTEPRAARALALINMAIMDAGISCWDAKYAYWLFRPSQADPAITLPIGLPNFPSYTSGHSTFSGAAAEVLAYLFPERDLAFQAMADEAGLSRVYGGIHYRFDSEVGLAAGRAIGRLAVDRGEADGSPPQ